MILHELAHAYHDQVLSFENRDIIGAYQAMKKEGIYEKVLLYTGRTVRHYGLSNHKEYFAESTEAIAAIELSFPLDNSLAEPAVSAEIIVLNLCF